jgi:hypothetical protein
VHSNHALAVHGPGEAGEGDALVTRSTDLALAVFTADCLPILLAARGEVAAVHAGWRGLASGVIAAAVAQIDEEVAAAWIGPAIGRCCYEVGADVAAAVADASAPDVVGTGAGKRPHLDLVAAARHQLRSAGVASERIHALGPCTRCDATSLWSYRRDGPGTGRNVAFIWRRAV